jgi:hypothetical protein
LPNFIETFIASSLEPDKSLPSTTKLSTSLMPSSTIPLVYRSFPAIPDRLFEDLVAIINLHAPTFITTNSTLGYSNAMSTTASALAAPLDAAGHAQLIAKHQKELAALNKKNGVVPRPRSSPKPAGHNKYCCIHGYQKSHIGADCNVLKANAQKEAVHRAAPSCHGPSLPCWWQPQCPRLTVRSKRQRSQDRT